MLSTPINKGGGTPPSNYLPGSQNPLFGANTMPHLIHCEVTELPCQLDTDPSMMGVVCLFDDGSKKEYEAPLECDVENACEGIAGEYGGDIEGVMESNDWGEELPQWWWTLKADHPIVVEGASACGLSIDVYLDALHNNPSEVVELRACYVGQGK